MNETLSADCYPVTLLPGMNRLYLDYCGGNDGARVFSGSLPRDGAWQRRPQAPAHWPELVRLLREQNPSPEAEPALNALAQGGGTVVTGQQVALFGGPLFTPFKMATAVARTRQANALGHPHAAVFWLASGDHDFAEVDHVVFPAGRELAKLVYPSAPELPLPVGRVVLDGSILPLVDRARELLGPSEATEALARAYQPGKTLAQAFREFYTALFGMHGLLMLDVKVEGRGRDFHRMGAPVLRAAIERAEELHAALLERNQALDAAGYHAQVAVLPQSSLLFLIDDKTGARQALKRRAPGAAEPGGLWQAGRQSYSTGDLLGILETEPERISPAALLRPVFQDFLLSSSLIIGGPAELAYFAQSAVLYERILGRQTPAAPRFSATLVEPSIAELMRRHELTLDRVLAESSSSLTQLLASRAMPPETRERLTSTGAALDSELAVLVDWLRSQDEGLGRSAETAASKMQYQMHRLRSLAANFQMQREASLARHAETIAQALYPGGVMQERLHGAAYYFARYGMELAETLSVHAEKTCPGHMAIWL